MFTTFKSIVVLQKFPKKIFIKNSLSFLRIFGKQFELFNTLQKCFVELFGNKIIMFHI